MSTFLCIGDQHFKVSNIPEVELFMEKILELVKEKRPDYIVCLGDLLDTHERIHTTPLNKAYDFIDSLRQITKVYVIVGNHDMISNQVFLTEDHWLNGMKEWENVVVVDKVTELRIKNNLLVFAPYVFPGRFIEALNTLGHEEWKNSKCIFAHQEFAGCKMGAIVSVDGDKWPVDYPEVISGHIHSRQKPQENIYYTGSAMQHAFGESTKNTIAYITIDEKDGYDLEEIDLKLPRKRIIYKDISEVDEWVVPNTEDKIKLTVSGVYDEFKALRKTKKYKKLVKSGVKVVFKPSKVKDVKEIPREKKEFSVILKELVDKERNRHLFKIYESVVNNKEVNLDDVLYLD